MNARDKWHARSPALFAVAVFLALILAASAPGAPPVDPGAQGVGGFDDRSPTVGDWTINWSLQARADALLARLQGTWHLSIDGTMGGRPVSYTGTLQADGTWNPALPCGNAHPLGVDLIAPLASPQFVQELLNDGPEITQITVSWDAGWHVVSWMSQGLTQEDFDFLARFGGSIVTLRSGPAGPAQFTVRGQGGLSAAEFAQLRKQEGQQLDDATFTLTVRAKVTVRVPPFAEVEVEVSKTVTGPVDQMDELVQKAQEQVNRTADAIADSIRAQLERLREKLKQVIEEATGGLKKFFGSLLH